MNNENNVNTKQTNERLSRRQAIVGGAAVLAGEGTLLSALGEARAQTPSGAAKPREGSAEGTGADSTNRGDLPPGQPGRDYTPVVTPNGVTLEWRIVDGWKV